MLPLAGHSTAPPGRKGWSPFATTHLSVLSVGSGLAFQVAWVVLSRAV